MGDEKTAASTSNPAATVSFRLRLMLYVATWIAVLIAVDVRLAALAYMFPSGIFKVLFPPRIAADPAWGWIFLGIGWVIYIVHAVLYFRARRPRTIWILYGVLVLILVCNVGGCRQMLQGTGYGWK